MHNLTRLSVQYTYLVDYTDISGFVSYNRQYVNLSVWPVLALSPCPVPLYNAALCSLAGIPSGAGQEFSLQACLDTVQSRPAPVLCPALSCLSTRSPVCLSILCLSQSGMPLQGIYRAPIEALLIMRLNTLADLA